MKPFRSKIFWIGLPKPHEHLITVDQFGPWKRHQVWANRKGKELRALLSQRFASNVVFLTLLTGTEIGILFSPSAPADQFRERLQAGDWDTWGYWTGFLLCLGIFLSICALYTNFIGWGIIANIGDDNVHAILRSTIGMYAAVLPQRLIVCSIYLFFAIFICILGLVMYWIAAVTIVILFILLMMHITSTYSALGRIIMDTGAMGDAIFYHKEEERLSPHDLYEELLHKVKVARKANIPVNRMYRIDYRASMRHIAMGGDVSTLDINRSVEVPAPNRTLPTWDEEEGKQEIVADSVQKEE